MSVNFTNILFKQYKVKDEMQKSTSKIKNNLAVSKEKNQIQKTNLNLGIKNAINLSNSKSRAGRNVRKFNF